MTPPSTSLLIWRWRSTVRTPLPVQDDPLYGVNLVLLTMGTSSNTGYS